MTILGVVKKLQKQSFMQCFSITVVFNWRRRSIAFCSGRSELWLDVLCAKLTSAAPDLMAKPPETGVSNPI
jgi:hypothetical protein